MGKIKLVHEMVVRPPVEAVFDYLINVDNYPELVTSMEEVRGHSGQLTAGATWQSVSRFMGREIIAENRVLELNAPQLFRYETLSNASDGISVWEVQAVDGGTAVRHVAEGEVKGVFGSLAMSVLKRNVNKQFNSDMERLERRLNQDL